MLIYLLQFDKKLEETVAEKDKEIAERDVKLNRLKQQMAESLKGNSWYVFTLCYLCIK